MFLTYVPVRSGLGGGRAHFVTCFLPMLLIEGVMLFCRRGFESCSSGDWAPWCYLLAGQRLHFLQQYITGFHSDGCILHDIKQRQNKTCPPSPFQHPTILPFLWSGWESFCFDYSGTSWIPSSAMETWAGVSSNSRNLADATKHAKRFWCVDGPVGGRWWWGVHTRESKTT